MKSRTSIKKEAFYDALYNTSTEVKVVEKDSYKGLHFVKSVYTFDLNDNLISIHTLEIINTDHPVFFLELY